MFRRDKRAQGNNYLTPRPWQSADKSITNHDNCAVQCDGEKCGGGIERERRERARDKEKERVRERESQWKETERERKREGERERERERGERK